MNHSKDNPQSIQDQLKNSLDRLFLSFQDCREGEIATYIPELAKADPNLFGAAIAHVDGSVTEHGDSQKEFTIQSISKPFVFGLALEENGREEGAETHRRRAKRRRIQQHSPTSKRTSV